jgi:diamine N-acetyltransferase
MNIGIIEVTEKNKQEILALRIGDAQRSFVESNEQSLKDAQEYKSFRPVGLYRDGELVGFAMYGYFQNEGKDGRVWLDRYLIDERFQGQGLGKIMLDALLVHLVEVYNCKEIYLSVYGKNLVAIHLYEKFGFRFNGEIESKGEKVMVKVL